MKVWIGDCTRVIIHPVSVTYLPICRNRAGYNRTQYTSQWKQCRVQLYPICFPMETVQGTTVPNILPNGNSAGYNRTQYTSRWKQYRVQPYPIHFPMETVQGTTVPDTLPDRNSTGYNRTRYTSQ